MQEHQQEFDVVITDSSDPVGWYQILQAFHIMQTSNTRNILFQAQPFLFSKKATSHY